MEGKITEIKGDHFIEMHLKRFEHYFLNYPNKICLATFKYKVHPVSIVGLNLILSLIWINYQHEVLMTVIIFEFVILIDYAANCFERKNDQ